MSIVLPGRASRACSCSTPSAATASVGIRYPLRALRGSLHDTAQALRQLHAPAAPQLATSGLPRLIPGCSGPQPCLPSLPAASTAGACFNARRGTLSQRFVAAGGPTNSCGPLSAPVSSSPSGWPRTALTGVGRTRVISRSPAGSAAANAGVSGDGGGLPTPAGPNANPAAADASAAVPPASPAGNGQEDQQETPVSPNGAPAAAAAGSIAQTAASAAASPDASSSASEPGREGAGAQPQDLETSAAPQTSSTTTSTEAAAGALEPSSSSSLTDFAAAEQQPQPQQPGATTVDGLPETQKYVLADEWGFSHVGSDLPEGASPATFSDMFPDRFFAFDGLRVAAALALPLAVMAAGYGWLWYWHSICPLWQQLLAGALIGTAYTGLFKVAHECARFAFLPQYPVLQDVLGAAIMVPALYPFPTWRLGFLDHLVHVNELWRDRFGWHPYTRLQLAMDVIGGHELALAARRLVLATPLKLLASVGHWLRTFEGLDLTRFHPGTYSGILLGWALPLLFAGFAIPAMIAAGGFATFATWYVFPWLVFHFWLSTLSLLAHTAPHIPWRPEGDGYDSGRAAICGTVTVRLPRPLEVLLNEANYGLPQMVAPGLPFYHARGAYEYMRERLQPYLTEASLSLKLLTNHVTKWQVYDEDLETYRPLYEVEEEVRGDLEEAEQLAIEELMAAAKAAEAEEQQQGQEQQGQQQRQQQGEAGRGPEEAGPGLAAA